LSGLNCRGSTVGAQMSGAQLSVYPFKDLITIEFL
jgi:hypothetical protein